MQNQTQSDNKTSSITVGRDTQGRLKYEVKIYFDASEEMESEFALVKARDMCTWIKEKEKSF